MAALRMFENDEKMVAYANEINRTTFSKVEFAERQMKEVSKELKKLSEEEAGLGDRLGSVADASGSVLKWLEKQLGEIEAKRNSLMQSHRELQLELDRLSTLSMEAKHLKKSLKVVFDRFERSEPAMQRGILRQLIEKVVVYRGNKVEVRWRVPCDEGGRRFDLKEEWGGLWKPVRLE